MLMLDDSNYLAVVNKGIVVLDFMADWCQPCKSVSAIMVGLTETYKTIMFAKVNVDNAPNMASVYGINSIPTVMVLKDNQLITMLVGGKCTLTNIKQALDAIV